MPGASLGSVEGDAFTGNVKIKLGPIKLSYRGQARYITKNADTRTIVIEGTGKDAKGSGAASATVTAVLTGDGDSTTVATATDLDVTGRPAQFGRGVMNDVANKLVGQFATNLAALLTSGDQEAATPGHPAPAVSTPAPGAPSATTQPPQAATPAGNELDVFDLLGLSPVARRRLAAALILADVFVLGWAIGRLGNRRWPTGTRTPDDPYRHHRQRSAAPARRRPSRAPRPPARRTAGASRRRSTPGRQGRPAPRRPGGPAGQGTGWQPWPAPPPPPSAPTHSPGPGPAQRQCARCPAASAGGPRCTNSLISLATR
jgi:uncharacterized protein